MKRSFSIKAFIITFLVLCLALSGFVYAKQSSLPAQRDALHSIVIPLSDTYLGDLQLDDDLSQESIEVDIEGSEEDDDVALAVIEEPVEPTIPVKGFVSLVIYDFGLSDRVSEAVLETQIKNLTLALSPYSRRPSYWIDTAFQFESNPWGSIYVYDSDSSEGSIQDYGPLAVRSGLKKDLNQRRMDIAFKSFQDVQGIMMFFNGDKAVPELSDVYNRVKEKELPLAVSSKVSPFDSRDVSFTDMRLDYTSTAAEVDSFFNDLIVQALTNGTSIGIVPPSPLVLKKLPEWQKQLDAAFIQMAPLGAPSNPS